MSHYSSHVVVLNITIDERLHAAASDLAAASFSLPFLTDLTIESRTKVPLFSLVLNTVKRSQCPLRNLSLHRFEDEDGCFSNILALSPELQHLKLTGIPPAEDLLRIQFDPTLPSTV